MYKWIQETKLENTEKEYCSEFLKSICICFLKWYKFDVRTMNLKDHFLKFAESSWVRSTW